MSRVENKEKDCVYVVRDCNDEDGPVISDDCGIRDRVVRAWAQTRYRNTADPVTPQRAVFVGVCEDD